MIDWLHEIAPADAPVVRIGGVFFAPAVGQLTIGERRLPAITDTDRDIGPAAEQVYAGKRATPDRDMAVAYLVDLAGVERSETARYAGWNDWQHPFDGRSKSVERHLKLGRRLLHELGAWPWSIEPRPPTYWRADETFIGALAYWHRAAWIASDIRAQAAVGAVTGDDADRLSLEASAQARYADALKRGTSNVRAV